MGSVHNRIDVEKPSHLALHMADNLIIYIIPV